MKKFLTVLITIYAVNSFAGSAPSKPKASDYIAQAEAEIAAQEAIEREAKIQAHAQMLANQKAADEAEERRKKINRIKKIARIIAYGLKSSCKLILGKTENTKEIITGTFTIGTIGTTSYYSYKHWSKIKFATNPKLWATIILSSFIISEIFE